LRTAKPRFYELAVGSDQHICERLQTEVESCTQMTVLDLKDVKPVDRTAVQFLGLCEPNGVELRSCPLYIREWILEEKKWTFK